jgi:nucleotide-binding universal stress UspA family protein
MVGSALLVAGVFVAWRRLFYEERARYLYSAVRGDDHVLVPVGMDGWPTVALGARLAAAHDAGKVVLLDVVDDAADTAAQGDALADDGEDVRTLDADAGTSPVERLETTATRVRERFDLPCEVVVAAGDPEAAVRRTAAEANCDLVAVDFAAPYARRVLAGDTDAVALRNATGVDDWTRVLVLVARAGDSAHAMIDFAGRLAGDGRVSVCTCIDDESERRRAETRLANLVETTTGDVETRVARSDVAAFVAANASVYDLVLVGASRDRSRASRLVVPPLFERLDDVTTAVDVAVVSRP